MVLPFSGSFITQHIIEQIAEVYRLITYAGTSDFLFQSLEKFDAVLYKDIAKIRNLVISPVAYTILALFLVLELHHVATRIEGHQGTLGTEMALKPIFKMLICKTVIDKVGDITGALYEISLHITSEIAKVFYVDITNSIQPNFVALENALNKYNLIEKFFISGKLNMICLLIGLCFLIVKVIVIARFFEIFIFIAISPLPLATLPHAEMSGIAKNFLKNFAAVCIHGVFIYLSLTLFGVLVNSAVLGALDGTDFNADLWKVLGYSFVLVICVIASGKWAKSLCNAI